MKTKPNDSAFPIASGHAAPEYGLTKREYFAALAMQGMVTNTPLLPWDILAETAVIIADSLIVELEEV